MDPVAPSSPTDPVPLPEPIRSKNIFRIKPLLPVIGLVLLLPVIAGAVKLRQLIAPQAAIPEGISKVRIHNYSSFLSSAPGNYGVFTQPNGPAVRLSALAVDFQDQTVPGDFTYQWSISSSPENASGAASQVGDLRVNPNDSKLATFFPGSSLGRADIYIKAFGSAGTAEGGIPVYVGIIPPPTPFPPPLPDLGSPGIAQPSPAPVVGTPVRITFSIYNLGLYLASPAEFSYASQADGYSTILPTNTCTANTVLNPQGGCISDYSFTFPTPGLKTLTVKLDPNNKLQESDENNNEISVSFNVAPTSSPSPKPSAWIKTGTYTVGCKSTLPVSYSASKMKFQMVSGGGRDNHISFYVYGSSGAGWQTTDGSNYDVTGKSAALDVGEWRETFDFGLTKTVNQQRFAVGCNDSETMNVDVYRFGPDDSNISTEEFACRNARGTWQQFSNSCADRCSAQPGPVACLAVLTMGCDCGSNGCWTGTTCVPNPNPTPTPTPTPTPRSSPSP
ncbi:MAG: CARDB domain-containing protein, partial [bacterium]|nr:CARDB domain-containing protein [bacterium]